MGKIGFVKNTEETIVNFEQHDIVTIYFEELLQHRNMCICELWYQLENAIMKIVNKNT